MRDYVENVSMAAAISRCAIRPEPEDTGALGGGNPLCCLCTDGADPQVGRLAQPLNDRPDAGDAP